MLHCFIVVHFASVFVIAIGLRTLLCLGFSVVDVPRNALRLHRALYHDSAESQYLCAFQLCR